DDLFFVAVFGAAPHPVARIGRYPKPALVIAIRSALPATCLCDLRTTIKHYNRARVIEANRTYSHVIAGKIYLPSPRPRGPPGIHGTPGAPFLPDPKRPAPPNPARPPPDLVSRPTRHRCRRHHRAAAAGGRTTNPRSD